MFPVDLGDDRRHLVPAGLGRRDGLVGRGRAVGVEIVHDQHDALDVGVADVDQRVDLVRAVDAHAPRSRIRPALATRRIAEEEHVDHAVALGLIVLPPGRAGACGQRPACIPQQLRIDLIHADMGAL